MGKMGVIYKSKGGIGSKGSDQEITDLLEEGSIKWQENNYCGSENSGSL